MAKLGDAGRELSYQLSYSGRRYVSPHCTTLVGMSFQTPLTIRAALAGIESHKYVLPAIQREFVWTPQQMIALLDSLMRGYPVGSFLFWTVDEDRSQDYRFYDFVLNYHQKDRPHCPVHEITQPRDLTAVLDGQQRLTSLNIAFRGSMAVKEKHKRRNDPKAYLERTMHLNLSRPAVENDEGSRFDFRLFTAAERKKQTDVYYPLPDVLKLGKKAFVEIHKFVAENGLSDNEFAFETLAELYSLVDDKPTISYFLEGEQDLDRVLNIFIRVNSGATKLSYSDLLMSIAAAQWSDQDARQMVHGLVDELNAIGDGYSFGKDFVLKAGLMLSDIASVGFKVENFNQANMDTLRRDWEKIEVTLLLTVELASDFGLLDAAITADSALLPVAYFLHNHPEPEKFRTATTYREQRESIRFFLVRSLLKKGVWGSGLDVTLTALRAVLRNNAGKAFPMADLEQAMEKRGHSLTFGDSEIDELLETTYGHKQIVPLLSLLFPHVDLRHKMHVDHVYPKSLLTRSRLKKAGLDSAVAERLSEERNLLPNLQLLDGVANQEKSSKAPAVWLAEHIPVEAKRDQYRDLHLIEALPAAPHEFNAFYKRRREQMRQRLIQLLRIS